MAIKIQLINCAQDPTIQKPEESAATMLKERFEEEFEKYPDAKGTLYILRSISIFGYKIRDIDLVLIAKLDNFRYRNKILTMNYGELCNLSIDSFICNIELKDVTSIFDENGNQRLWKLATAYVYNYKKSGKKDITEQAFDQMNSFREYMYDTIGISPFMVDMIWFRGLRHDQLAELRGNEKDNALAVDFSFKQLIETMLLRMNVERDQNGIYHLDSFKGSKNDISSLTKFLCEKREARGLTKKKFELLSQSSFDINYLKQGVGEKLKILTGRAGTGKTIQLLQLAFHLADTTNQKRCLLLTYNNALVSDIRRLIDFSNIPVGMDCRTVSVQTVDSFFVQLLKLFEIVKAKDLIPTSNNYEKEFNAALKVFYLKILKDLNDNDVIALKDMADSFVDWDYILIDEAQDWPDLHKNVLYKLYGTKRIVVADGVDQFIMSKSRQDWSIGINALEVIKPKEMVVEMRQKAFLVLFLNAFSRELNLGWEIKPNYNLTGGSIDIYSGYSSDIHSELYNHCRKSGCENYDILILVPRTQVEKDANGERHFRKAEAYSRANIAIFDGTNTSTRHRYPTKDVARLYQYHSCRGLEGWITVCFEFDELIRCMLEDICVEEIRERYPGLSIEEGKKRFVYTWALMPLTRPVDSLVITLKDPNSEIGVILKNLSNQFSDFMTWHIN